MYFFTKMSMSSSVDMYFDCKTIPDVERKVGGQCEYLGTVRVDIKSFNHEARVGDVISRLVDMAFGELKEQARSRGGDFVYGIEEVSVRAGYAFLGLFPITPRRVTYVAEFGKET